MLNLLALFLNWLDMREPTEIASSPSWLFRQPSVAEVASITQWHQQMEAWSSLGPVAAADLGRGSVAGQRMEDLLRKLEVHADRLRGDLAPYVQPRRFAGTSANRDAGSYVVGSMPGAPLLASVLLVASRIKFFGTPTFDPRPYLDDYARPLFEQPSAFPAVPAGPSPKTRMQCSRSQFIDLCRLLRSTDRLLIYDARLFRPMPQSCSPRRSEGQLF